MVHGTLARVLMRTLLTLVFAGVLVALGLGVLTQTAWGRAQVARLVSQYANERIRGNLKIGGVDELSFSRIVARDVIIRDPEGQPAIQVPLAELEPDISRLLRGELASARARVRDGMVALRESPDGKLNIEEAFRGKRQDEKQGDGEKQEKRPKVQVDFRNIATTNMRLTLSGGSLPSLQFAGVSGIMRVQTAKDVHVWLQFDQYSGAMTPALPAGALQFRDVSGHVQTGGNRLLRFEGHGESGGDALHFAIDFVKEPAKQVTLDLSFSEPSGKAFASRLASLYSKLSDKVEVNVSQER